MSFWDKVKNSMRTMMIGRNGPDQLSTASLFLGLFLLLLASFTGSSIIHTLSLVAYGYCLFRMFSRNTAKRQSENLKYASWAFKARTAVSQNWQRLKNLGKYKYVSCPECKTLLRLPRKGKDGKRLGSVTVTCTKCRHAFTAKA